MELRTKICLITSIFLGVAMVVIGSAIYTKVFPSIVADKIDENLVLKNNSEALTRFKNPEVPTYMKFYFFNVSNKDEVNEKGAKPVLKEVGPYVYRKELIRKITEWDNYESTISYKEVSTYYFEPGMSEGTRQDIINHVNFISVSLLKSDKIDLLASLTKTNKTEMIENAPGQLVESHRVDDLLYQGINITGYIPPYNDTVLPIKDICIFVDNCKYAFFLKKNDTESELYEVKTGAPPANSSEALVESMKHYREIVGFRGLRSLPYWNGTSCNALNGTDGTQFAPQVDPSKRLYVFTTEVCRSLYLEYEKSQDIKGIGALRFVIPRFEYASPEENPDNWCFVPENTPKELSSLGGVLPVASCYRGYPIIASAPHFYMADEQYRENFEGLHPEKNLHESFLDVDPMTGVTLSAIKRLQMSIRIDPDPRPKFLKFINKTIAFPIFWAEEGGIIDEKNVKMLNDQLFTPYKAGKWSLVALMALGSLIFLVALLIFVKMFITGNHYPSVDRDTSGHEEKITNCTLNNFHRTMDQSHTPTLGTAIKENQKKYSSENCNPYTN